MNKERLHTLAAFLRKVKPQHFDLDHWCDLDGGKLKNGALKERGCGTTACALGWAPSIPEFRARGLQLKNLAARGDTPDIDVIFKARGKTYSGEDAAAMFFGLTKTQSEYLFMPDYYPREALGDPEYVADRIDALAKGYVDYDDFGRANNDNMHIEIKADGE